MNKILKTIGCLISLMIASTTQAEWNAEEQQLIDHTKMCWTAWVDGGDRGADYFFDRCPTDEDFSMWWTEDGAPQSIETIRRDWDRIAEIDINWVDLRPVEINIWDDFAMVQFYGYLLANTNDGAALSENKRTELFRRVDGNLISLGGQGSPASAADAEPYQ
jgi:hypothetical protein